VPEGTVTTLAVTFFAALGSFTYGYNSAIMGSVTELPSFFFHLGIAYASANGSLITGAINDVNCSGGAIGCWTITYLADYLAYEIQIICIISITSAALQADSVHIVMLLVAQFMGVSIGWINSIVSTC
jgi:hypothetical protein